MKKLLALLAFCGFASSASAVSLAWTVSGISFDGETLKSDNNVTASLILLGKNVSLSESYDIETVKGWTAVDSVSETNTKGAAVGTYNFPDTTDYTTYNGNVYAILLSYTSAGKTYYNLSSASYTVSGVANATSTLTSFKPASSTFAYGTKSESSTITAGGGWTVPEPSTAALALAGLALLLKRRKA